MPKLFFARPCQDATEERQVRKLAGSRCAWQLGSPRRVDSLESARLAYHRHHQGTPALSALSASHVECQG